MNRRMVLSAVGLLGVAGTAPRGARASSGTPEADAAADAAIVVPVEVSEWAIAPAQSVFRVGQAYRFEVANRGKLTHEWVMEPAAANDQPLEREGGPDDEPAVSELEDIGPGATKSLTWSFTEPGDFKMVCHIEGHAEAGMTLPFTVIAEAKVVEVEATDFALALGSDTVPAGSPVAFVVRNRGNVVHEFVLEPKGASDEPLQDGDRTGEIEDIEPGAVRELIWTFAEPAAIQTTCHVEGHLEAGMIAYLDVTG